MEEFQCSVCLSIINKPCIKHEETISQCWENILQSAMLLGVERWEGLFPSNNILIEI